MATYRDRWVVDLDAVIAYARTPNPKPEARLSCSTRDPAGTMKLIVALLFGAASALQPANKPAMDRRAAMKVVFPAAVVAALAPAALAAKPPQLQSMTRKGKEKKPQFKSMNPGTIMKH